MQLFVAGGVPIPSAMSPLFGASAVALQHQPVGSKSKLADEHIPKFELNNHSLTFHTYYIYDLFHLIIKRPFR